MEVQPECSRPYQPVGANEVTLALVQNCANRSLVHTESLPPLIVSQEDAHRCSRTSSLVSSPWQELTQK